LGGWEADGMNIGRPTFKNLKPRIVKVRAGKKHA
jgi:hypothetical protein